MTNIKDIARLAEVSVSTVSRVLNNHPYVNDEKRNKVEQVIEELKFHQNLNAIHLVKGKTLTVGVIIPYIDHPYFQAMVGGVMKNAFMHNYSVLCCPTSYDKEEELKYLDMLKGKNLDGLIICSRSNDWNTIIPYTEYGPIVSCERFEKLPCAYTDHYDAFLTGINYLIEEGHRKIGYCTGRKYSLSSKMRYAAFKAALTKIDQPILDDWMFTDCYTMNDGKRIINKLRDLNSIPTAILTNGDEVAAGMISQSEMIGLKVPEELSIIGFDNNPMSEALGLTTLESNIKEIGEQAFTLFYTDSNEQVKIPFKLVKRHTVSTIA
ncbi:LacI family DNA-binding transcriptional regulator [Lentibacillus sp. CBA3610]|uniref:LacI family DNA-binding transcriptional regulator n=1 Tax=Lentibacillus sp. CBA3610 TaxID=2518176 RepID=UPI0015957F0C|nr:LacI family DNA-binding transcriptional regulator [Lentibacillus sp. CBA3610]QKY70626.1 LacI family DNA-binding transcriptional regulator [Lentibacillus sp. CBA3610]